MTQQKFNQKQQQQQQQQQQQSSKQASLGLLFSSPFSAASSSTSRRRNGCFFVVVIGFALLNFVIANIILYIQQQQQQSSSSSSWGSIGNTQQHSILLPPLESILNIETGEIIGDPQSLLDFAIIGHGKCGTTSLQYWLSQPQQQQQQQQQQQHLLETNCPPEEILELSLGTPKDFILRLYLEASKVDENYNNNNNNNIDGVLGGGGGSVDVTTTTNNEQWLLRQQRQGQMILKKTKKLGYKNPGEIRFIHSIQFLSNYFPKTVLIVGIRHPVEWFESLYNFKVQNLRPEFPSNFWGNPNKLIDHCNDPKIFHCVGTRKGAFHVHLAQLGKTTNISKLIFRDDEYNKLVVQPQPQQGENNNNNNTSWIFPITPNPVFLFDVHQLGDSNTTRMGQFQSDLQRVLGLKQSSSNNNHNHAWEGRSSSLSSSWSSIPRRIPGKVLPPDIQADRDQHKIRICDEQYVPVRKELLKIAQQTSEFIRTSGFLDNPTVHVSSRDYFEYILQHYWMKDPCEDKGENDGTQKM